MAIYRIFPVKDTFIYSELSSGSAGIDEILEIAGYEDSSGVGRTSRTLIQFRTEDIQSVVNNNLNGASISASIKLFLAEASEIPADYTIYGYPISQSWTNGVGKFSDVPIDTSGASWKYTLVNTGEEWDFMNLNTNVTSSYIDGQEGGASWYTGSGGNDLASFQRHSLYSNDDLELDVSNAIELFYSESLDNNGFVLKLQNSLEFNTSSSIKLRYFSRDTNTIYPPYLEFKWDDSSYVTGSLSVLSSSNSTVGIKNNKGIYTDEEKIRFRINAKPKYPVRTFTTSSIYSTGYALPSGSYYGLKDENTGEMVIDFNTAFTKISCDSNGPFFDLFLNSLQPERYYRLLIKTTIDGSDIIYDDKNIFKLIRNGTRS